MVDAVPLAKDADGVYRVAGSRVTLDVIVRAFNRGATAEEIVQDFPSLQLPDVYQVIGYYLKHGSELAEYFEQRGREEQELLATHENWSPLGFRERLLARNGRARWLDEDRQIEHGSRTRARTPDTEWPQIVLGEVQHADDMWR